MNQKLFLFVFMILIVACTTSRQTTTTTKTKESECSVVQLLKSPADSLRIDPYEIDSLNIADGCLELFVNYGGGCGNAQFELYHTNRIMESMPPITVLYLAFADDDPCRSIETKKLSFSLSPFKRYADEGGIYLKIAGTGKGVFYKKSE